MFEIESPEAGHVVMRGRLDAAQAERAEAFLSVLEGACTINLAELEYISSAGLGVLLKTHKQVAESGNRLRLIQVTNHIADIFKYSGFDKLFDIETA